MSKSTHADLGDEAASIAQETRREKKSKKAKKDVTPQPQPDDSIADPVDDVADSSTKKRKRHAIPDEIEIDVSLPEPASKKAARKAKKAKVNPTTDQDKQDITSEAKPAGGSKDDKDLANKRSEFGVWIGNLPWSATKDSLREFLVSNAEMKSETITRIHLPPPTKPANPNWTTKPLNKGFAYVDFASELAMYSAIALTETKMDGRALLIKNAKSFEGRPDKPKTEPEQDGDRKGKAAGKQGHPPNKRVFVGNLSFDVTKEDLETHFGQCGPVEHIHMATFEDSGKCKGYAWITFQDVDAATSAVKGFVFKDESEFKGKKKEEDSDEESDDKKPKKKRKWLLNKLFGRELRCEFAEDSTTRYNKRYGKDAQHEAVDGVNPDRWKNFSKGRGQSGEGAETGRAGGGGGRREKKVDPRTIKSGAAHMSAPRASQAIVASQGKKTTFD